MHTTHPTAVDKFDASRASEYAQQSRIALAGYEACHELSACMLAASLSEGRHAHVLVVGAGDTAQEILAMAHLEPRWRFTAVDPSPSMLEAARQRLASHGVQARTEWVLGPVETLTSMTRYDAATVIGVLHHVPGDEAKHRLLGAIQARLKPGAPLIVAGKDSARCRPATHRGGRATSVERSRVR